MRKTLILTFLIFIFTTTVFAQDNTKHHVFGGYFSLGAATTLNESSFGKIEKPKPIFAMGGGGYYDYYFNKFMGLGSGIEFFEKGNYIKSDKITNKFLSMQFPTNFLLNFWGVRVQAGVSFNYLLTGKVITKIDGKKYTYKLSGSDWSGFRRFNISAKAMVGYCISAGPVGIVPSFTWSMDILNNDVSDSKSFFSTRFMNFMFNIGLEFGV
ncbi:MAG: hypothetical protein ACOX2F_05290 [bacterium]